jgi:predicted MFS family arabinose efflux permease
MIMPFSSAFLVNNVLIDQENLPLIFLFTGIGAMLIMPIIGKLSDKYNRFYLFTIGSAVASIMILIYTNLGPTPLWLVVIINMILFIGIMSRMVPATALNSAVPEAKDRGAYMSINSSLQQLSGGIAAAISGLIVIQTSTGSPLQNFNLLGYFMLFFMFVCVLLLRKVNRIVRNKITSEG